jgi:hypothetical protein
MEFKCIVSKKSNMILQKAIVIFVRVYFNHQRFPRPLQNTYKANPINSTLSKTYIIFEVQRNYKIMLSNLFGIFAT